MLAVIFLSGESCSPCKKFYPDWDKLKSSLESKIKMRKYVYEEKDNKNFFKKLKIRSMPTLLIIEFDENNCVKSSKGTISLTKSDCKILQKYSGNLNYEDVKNWINKYIK